ncbi:hypothetical protein J3458_002653 [Metarhizium acridum]|uniref:uncharacterized protein n=1 Tax=Metarhizium acridum TaxID=92637 RepID=UPI001C6BC28F|nr:hypothetical protein J3458_002653 [Metarhizium acridum]
MTRDIGAFLISQIHLNLCVGTIGALEHRPDLRPLLKELMAFETCASFLLTEFGHGLDIRNLETTAIALPDGSFDLHTPNRNAAKSMPPSTPLARVRRVGIVMARLFVKGEDRGLKLFLVPLASSSSQYPGITSWLLPVRPGTTPLDHSITSFNHVKLPSSALLGTTSKPDNFHDDIHRQLWRLSVGAIALSLGHISCLKIGTYIAARYGKRRFVQYSADREAVPIISFSTQYRPVLRGLVAAEMLSILAEWCISILRKPDVSINTRRNIAVVFKATAVHYHGVLSELAERCGWRGYFTHNQIAELYLSFSGNATGEGDVHVLSLRLAHELLTGRCVLPKPADQDSTLARHEAGVFSELQDDLRGSTSPSERNVLFNKRIAPLCQSFVLAIGQRMAFEAARQSTRVSSNVIDAFEKMCIAEDAAWYMEHLGLTRKHILGMEVDAYEALLPNLDGMLEKTGAKPFVTSPLVSDNEWEDVLSLCSKFASPGLGAKL